MAILIPTTTAAVTSKPFNANANNTGILANNLGTGETVKLQVYDETINDYVDAKIAGVVPKADSSNNMIAITQDAFQYRVVKSATVNSVGVAIYQNSVKVGGYK